MTKHAMGEQKTNGKIETIGVGDKDVTEYVTSETPTKRPTHDGRNLLVLLRTSQCLQCKSLLECLKELPTEVNVQFIEKRGSVSCLYTLET